MMCRGKAQGHQSRHNHQQTPDLLHSRNLGKIRLSKYDYVVDAIDTVTGKIELVMQADKAKTPIICSMGAGNKLDPTAFEVADIYKNLGLSSCKGYETRTQKREVSKS